MSSLRNLIVKCIHKETLYTVLYCRAIIKTLFGAVRHKDGFLFQIPQLNSKAFSAIKKNHLILQKYFYFQHRNCLNCIASGEFCHMAVVSACFPEKYSIQNGENLRMFLLE